MSIFFFPKRCVRCKKLLAKDGYLDELELNLADALYIEHGAIDGGRDKSYIMPQCKECYEKYGPLVPRDIVLKEEEVDGLVRFE